MTPTLWMSSCGCTFHCNQGSRVFATIYNIIHNSTIRWLSKIVSPLVVGSFLTPTKANKHVFKWLKLSYFIILDLWTNYTNLIFDPYYTNYKDCFSIIRMFHNIAIALVPTHAKKLYMSFWTSHTSNKDTTVDNA